jgi:hypothetical protein
MPVKRDPADNKQERRLHEPATTKASTTQKIVGFCLAANEHWTKLEEEDASEQAVGKAHSRANCHHDDDPKRCDVEELAHQA